MFDIGLHETSAALPLTGLGSMAFCVQARGRFSVRSVFIAVICAAIVYGIVFVSETMPWEPDVYFRASIKDDCGIVSETIVTANVSDEGRFLLVYAIKAPKDAKPCNPVITLRSGRYGHETEQVIEADFNDFYKDNDELVWDETVEIDNSYTFPKSKPQSIALDVDNEGQEKRYIPQSLSFKTHWRYVFIKQSNSAVRSAGTVSTVAEWETTTEEPIIRSEAILEPYWLYQYRGAIVTALSALLGSLMSLLLTKDAVQDFKLAGRALVRMRHHRD